MTDYQFFYVDVDGINIRPPYPLRSESERRILGIDDLCWAYEAACTITCKQVPAANRKAKFSGPSLSMYFWKEAVNMVKDCMTKDKYNALIGTSWFDEPREIYVLHNSNGENIDDPFEGLYPSDVLREKLSENNIFHYNNALPDDLSDLITRLDSKSRLLSGIDTFWHYVSKLSTFFEHSGICAYENESSVHSFRESAQRIEVYSSGERIVTDIENTSGASGYQMEFDNRASVTLNQRVITRSAELYITVTNQAFSKYVDKILCPTFERMCRQTWTEHLANFGDMWLRLRVCDLVAILMRDNGFDDNSGFRFDLTPPIGSWSECHDLMVSLGYSGNNVEYLAVNEWCNMTRLAIFKMRFPWTVDEEA